MKKKNHAVPKFEFEDEDGAQISLSINEQWGTLNVGITDSAGRSTGAIGIPVEEVKEMFQAVLIAIHELEERAHYEARRSR